MAVKHFKKNKREEKKTHENDFQCLISSDKKKGRGGKREEGVEKGLNNC